MKRLKSFLLDTRGAFAVVFAVMALPVIALGGAGVDYALFLRAKQLAQIAADTSALAVAANDRASAAEQKKIAYSYAAHPLADDPQLKLTKVEATEEGDRVLVRVEGVIPTFFVSLVGVDELFVTAEGIAERAAGGALELAMVLDNTWSMSASDGSGSTKIKALQAAARSLLKVVAGDKWENSRVAIVPYADYVNVGMGNRSKPWLTVPADYSTSTPKTCVTKTTKQQCVKGTPKTCTRTVDGVGESYDCTPSTCTTVSVAPYQSCSGGGTTNYKWYGCVLSRTREAVRLNDLEPQTDYVGFLGSAQNCLSPILPLTNHNGKLESAISTMTVSAGSYRPLTYIPTGMLWGINVLSPTAPFEEGAAYDGENFEPRKVIVLMTDGDNTLKYVNDGRHTGLSSNVTTAANEKKKTDADTLALCSYAKSNKIEVFTVAFGALTITSQDMLRACASSSDNFFKATSASELNDAFQSIGAAIKQIRLVR